MDTIDRYLLTFLLNSLWQVPLAAAAAALICRGMLNGPAQHRHLVWVAALVAAVLLPAASTRRWTPDPSTVAVPQRALVEARAVAAAIEANAPEPVRQPAPRVVPVAKNIAGVVLAAYLLLLGLRLAWLARAALRTVRTRTGARPSVGAGIDRVCARCAAAFGVRVDVRISAMLPGPVSAGSTIILPESLLVETSEDILTTAIGHEMAHVARRDFWLNLFYELLYTPVAFQPAVLWIRREIARTREMACDEMVAGRLLTPRVYAGVACEHRAAHDGTTRAGLRARSF